MPSLRGLTESTAANLIALAVLALGAGLLSLLDFSVPVWIVLVALAGGLLGGYRLGRVVTEDKDLLDFHAEHLGDAILTLREILDGQLQNVSLRSLWSEEFSRRLASALPSCLARMYGFPYSS